MNRESEVIQQRIDATRASLAGKFEQLEALGATVGDRIETVADATGQTIEVLNDAVQSVKTRVVSMQESCNLTKHVERRPWTMVAGATALAFVGSSIQHRRSTTRTPSPQSDRPSAAMRRARPERPASRPMSQPEGPSAAMRPEVTPESRSMAKSGAAKPRGGGFGVMFQSEIAQLRGLALGMLFGVVRDVVKDSVSKPMGQQVDGVIEGLANRMGGKPFQGRILPERKRPEPVSDMDSPATAVPPGGRET